jgi:hypothetical protein
MLKISNILVEHTVLVHNAAEPKQKIMKIMKTTTGSRGVRVMTTFLEVARSPGISSLHAVITMLFHVSCMLTYCLDIQQSAIFNVHNACTDHVYNSSAKFSQLILSVHNNDTVTALSIKNVCGNSGVKGKA